MAGKHRNILNITLGESELCLEHQITLYRRLFVADKTLEMYSLTVSDEVKVSAKLACATSAAHHLLP